MKNQTKTNLVICSFIALALILSLATWSQGQAQSAGPADGKMMQHCMEMKEHKEKMKAEMKAMDDELTAQLAEMNAAPKCKKMDLMAAVLTREVEQRIAMDAKKAQMQEMMMKHMMEHIKMGPESVSQCPMMKDMGGMDEKAPSAGK